MSTIAGKGHIGVDADTGRIVTAELTAHNVDDASQLGSLLDQVKDPIGSFTADGAYDQDGVYCEVAARHPDSAVIVPPRSNAVPSATAETAPIKRDKHLRAIAERGRMGWQKALGLAEGDVGAIPREAADNRRADAARPSGHEGGFAGEGKGQAGHGLRSVACSWSEDAPAIFHRLG